MLLELVVGCISPIGLEGGKRSTVKGWMLIGEVARRAFVAGAKADEEEDCCGLIELREK